MKLWVNKGQYGFSTRLKSGNANGNDEDAVSMFINVQFRKGQEPEDNCQIETKGNEFLSCYASKDGVKPKLVVLDYAIISGHNAEKPKAEQIDNAIPEKTSYTAQELADEAIVDFGDIVEFEDSDLAF